jgi:hypothetical protein
MGILNRREFLRNAQRALSGVAMLPLLDWQNVATAQSYNAPVTSGGACWLDVCAPFIVENEAAGIHSEIVLTSDTFVGRKGHEDRLDSTEYEIYLYDVAGKAVGADGVAKRLTVPAMQTTVIPVGDILNGAKNFAGGMRVRLRPKGREPMHASDLFSSAFVRWSTADSFDNVHANPDPLEWQRPDKFFYSMPFPPLKEYECVFGMFNPYGESSSGSLFIHESSGRKVQEVFYDLKPYASRFFDLRAGKFVSDVAGAFTETATSPRSETKMVTEDGGTIAVTNRQGSVKSFGYLAIKRPGRPRFSIDHPIHQSPFEPLRSDEPFDDAGRFKAKNILYTPLAFRSKQIGGVTLDTRFHLSSGAPIEEFLWLSPFITDATGEVAWMAKDGSDLPSSISRKQIHRHAIKLGGQQSCILDCSELSLPQKFAGGLFLGVKLNTNHTLMKVEINVAEWGAHAFTHFRPGLSSARTYQKARQRGGLMTDYVASGSRLERNGKKILRDEVVGVLNIDDKGIAGKPMLEVFSSGGLITRIELGEVPGFACRHYLLSELMPGNAPSGDLSLRLVDENATLVMSVLHLDHVRRDIALDHGSDRFSTFHEYDCDPKI